MSDEGELREQIARLERRIDDLDYDIGDLEGQRDKAEEERDELETKLADIESAKKQAIVDDALMPFDPSGFQLRLRYGNKHPDSIRDWWMKL